MELDVLGLVGEHLPVEFDRLLAFAPLLRSARLFEGAFAVVAARRPDFVS